MDNAWSVKGSTEMARTGSLLLSLTVTASAIQHEQTITMPMLNVKQLDIYHESCRGSSGTSYNTEED